MGKTLKDLHGLMIDQLHRRGFYPHDVNEILFRIVEEVGEVAEALRENHSTEKLGNEIVDVLWNLMRLCELKEIDLTAAFLKKLAFNETRPLE